MMAVLFPDKLTAGEWSSLHEYSQAVITPRKQWPGAGLQYPGRPPAQAGDPLFLDNIQSARISLTSETAGTLSNTTYEIASGSFRVSEDSTGKYIECIASGILHRRNIAAYGTWELGLSKPDAVSIDASFVTPSSDGSAPGYRLLVNTSEVVGVIRIGASNITVSSAGYVDDGRYTYTVTRSASGEFTTYISGGAYPVGTLLDSSGGGSNPKTDNVVTDSQYVTLALSAGCKLYSDRQFSGVVAP
jgi:hypothetical protein